MTDSVVRIFESELACIAHETSIHPNIETGGSLYGLWTDAGNPTILLATRPGPQAVRQPTQFEQDPTAHLAIEQVLVNGFGAQAVGLWHSHHSLGLHELSGGDLNRTTRFARRTTRKRFCDLLSYFDEDVHSKVTVKPYLYVDAGLGTRAPTSFVVLPGTSPVRTALTGIAALEEFQFALALPPPQWRPQWRLVRSVELGAREDEDAPGQPRRGFSLLRRKNRPVPEESGAIVSARQPPFAIADLPRYVSEHLEPALRNLPGDLSCELEPIGEGHYLRLTMVSASRTQEHVLALGWDGTGPVVIGHSCRRADRPNPADLLAEGETVALRQRIEQVVVSFEKPTGRR
jgi:hypothetical protein